MKWADFGLSKSLDSQGNHNISGVRRTVGWMAPEILTIEASTDLAEMKGARASDTFSSGCLFFSYLTDGLHPFGSGVNSFTLYERRIITCILLALFLNEHSTTKESLCP